MSAWWMAPLAVCLVLTGIHGYLGIHVLKRKVIFVDLAMAQIAALGAAYAVLLGYDPRHEENSVPIYLFSLGFTLLGAAVISLTRMRRERVPHEALIGIVYASASAGAMLLLSKSSSEGEQIKHMLAGSLLTVTWAKVGVTAAIYSLLGLFHGLFRRTFFRISDDPERAAAEGVPVRLWDFLFYVTFGVVITSSVSIAGVLLVFSYLVVPAVVAVLFVQESGARVRLAWIVGAAVSAAGLALSNYGEFPTGPSIVAVFAVTLVAAGIVHYVVCHERSGVAVRRLLAGGAVAALALWGTTFLRKAEPPHDHHEDDLARYAADLRSDNETVQLDAIHHLEATGDRHVVAPLLDLLRSTKSDRIMEHCAQALAKLGAPEAVPALQELLSHDLDHELKISLAVAILDLRDPAGFAVLVEVAEAGETPAAKAAARKVIRERARLAPGDEVDLLGWWRKRSAVLRWRSEAGRFE